MRSVPRTFRILRWGQLFSVLLVGALLMQGPLQGLVQVAPETGRAHQCAHTHHDVCPRNPDGPCTCAHSDPGDTDAEGPILRACHGGTDADGPVPTPRWQVPGAPAAVPSPRVSAVGHWALARLLSPQRLGDGVFRPPRTTPLVRLT